VGAEALEGPGEVAHAMRRSILKMPVRQPRTKAAKARHLLTGGAAFLPYLISAKVAGCPGTSLRAPMASLAVRTLLANGFQSWFEAYRLIVGPMDSVRYFEFDFAQHATKGLSVSDYLDVSSPRLLPILLLRHNPAATATLLNPDTVDLDGTRNLIRSVGLSPRCLIDGRLIGDCNFDSQFDLITSISVVEHIPEDSAAIEVMWRALRKGGRLVITVPCARQPYEEYAEFNQYGLLPANHEGLVFWQRFYSKGCLQKNIFTITGEPREMKVFGEIRSGSYDRNVESKMFDAAYPIWREPWYVAREWKYFPDFDSLPGVGVVGMTFVKES
jgi:SAM-dependent methyltransferase